MNCKQTSCSQNILPQTAKYFKEELVAQVLEIPPHKPDMERVSNIIVSAEVESFKLVDTLVGVSNEGQHLSGSKIVAEVRVKQKVLYVADEATQSVHASHYETLSSVFVVLPPLMNGDTICDLYRGNRLNVSVYVETNTFRPLDCRNIYSCVMLFLDVKTC